MGRAYLYLFFFLPMTFLVSFSAGLCALVDSSGRLYDLHARFWAKTALGLSGTPVSVKGAEHIPEGSCIFMSNHQSNFDILSLIAKLPRRIYWIAKKELFDIPVFGTSMRRAGYIPLDRSNGRNALKSMELAAKIIRNGKDVVMFPEGTRSPDRALLPFKRGGFMLAVRAGVPVVPVTINGSGLVNPSGKIELYSGSIEITVHPAIFIPVDMKKSDAEEWLEKEVHNSIGSVLEV